MSQGEPTHLDLFSGIGGFALAARWAGFRTVAFCEIDPYCQALLAKNFGAVLADSKSRIRLGKAQGSARHSTLRGEDVADSESDEDRRLQQPRLSPNIGAGSPIFSNIFDFNGSRYRGVTLLTGGFPKKRASHAFVGCSEPDRNMRYVNIDLTVFSEPEFSEASPKQVGIWLRLYAYCAARENHGLINTAGAWSDAHCKIVLNCSRKDLEHSSLWFIRPSGQLNLFHYNLIAEEFSKQRRKTQRIAASRRSEAKTIAVRENGKKGGRPKKILPFTAYQKEA